MKEYLRTCILCGKETNGSIGRTGFKWRRICQECKNIEDTTILRQLDAQAKVLDKLDEVMG